MDFTADMRRLQRAEFHGPHAAAKWGNRVSQFEKGLAFQEGKEENKSLDNALAWYIASATPTNHVVQNLPRPSLILLTYITF